MASRINERVVGIVDCLGYLVCKRCHDVGHGAGNGQAVEAVIFAGATHSDEPCDYCASLLCNEGEP